MHTVKLNVFEIFSLSWISFSLLALLLVLLKLFVFPTLIIAIFFVAFLIYILHKKEFISITGLEKSSWIILGFICALAILFSIFTTPTIFGGRDEGSYATSGIMMANNNTTSYSSELISQFYKIYSTI